MSPTTSASADKLLRRGVSHNAVEFFTRTEQFLHRCSEPRKFQRRWLYAWRAAEALF